MDQLIIALRVYALHLRHPGEEVVGIGEYDFTLIYVRQPSPRTMQVWTFRAILA